MPDDAAPARTVRRDSGPEPLWEQAAAVILEDIGRRGLSAGARLPPERELCARLGISRITLRKALAHLVDRGVATASHGRGWFLASPGTSRDWPNDLESFTATARRKQLRPGSLVLRQEVAPASLDQADRLAVAAGTPVFHLDRVRLLDDVRIAVDRTLLPAELAPGLDRVDFGSASLFEELRARGLEPDRSEATIEARGADAVLAGHLGIAPGAPVLVLDQAVYGREQRPLLLSTVEYSGERYRLRTTLPSG
ncbi:GntR family transcriptional regulator [Streptacidiphilus sp. P02-A3a]|uniref:GntR family transcriptional regulator n=1 Tax=Streptacidiphilus sp. P02-A3a TaxID=2704468 RepID=UPI0015F787DA|nr:GntR family transcriptional regulator [Streptacidiphilus sp. P02-A3a]QMU71355.1 GntR family transcriptional regulator [Streptacidiphilus sp. P02-A3a]